MFAKISLIIKKNSVWYLVLAHLFIKVPRSGDREKISCLTFRFAELKQIQKNLYLSY